jgi:hypothetical protein
MLPIVLLEFNSRSNPNPRPNAAAIRTGYGKRLSCVAVKI